MRIDLVPPPTVAIRQDSFDPAQAARSVLCMEVSKDRFRFAVLSDSRRLYWLEDYAFPSLLTERPLTETLPVISQNHPVLQADPDTERPWQQIRVAINAPSFTLVPKPLFRKEYASSYLSLMRGSALPTHEFPQAFEHDEGFVSVFNLEYRLTEYFSATYPLQQLTFVHQTSTLIRASEAVDSQLASAHNLLLYFEDEFVTIVFRANRQLRYCNRFGYKSPQDLTYYVLYVIDELKLEPFSVNIMLYGEVTPFADTYVELTRFLPHMSFGPTPPHLTLTGDFDELPEHRYLSMYGLALLAV